VDVPLVSALELANLAEQTVVIAHSAVARTENREAHMREMTFQQRDDKNWLKHTVAWKDADWRVHLRLSPGASEHTFQRSGSFPPAERTTNTSVRRQQAMAASNQESPKCPSSRFHANSKVGKATTGRHRKMVCTQGFRIYRWDPDSWRTISRRPFGGAGGYLEMNVYKPLMIANLTQSITLLQRRVHEFPPIWSKDAAESKKIAEYVQRSLMLVTALASRHRI